MRESRAATAGARAAAALAAVQNGVIAGVTSRGTFVRYAGEHVLFITVEPSRGPLTVNLPGNAGQTGLGLLSAGMAASLGGGRLTVPAAAVSFDLSGAELWSAPPPALPALPAEGRAAAARALAAQLAGATASDFAAWLKEPATDAPPDLRRLRSALRAHDVAAVVAFACEALLGRGRGLTPSGDDCVAGLLLALNRWRVDLWPGPGLEALNDAMVPAAFRLTTAISASLIECAACGEADERLIAAVDALMTGVPSLDRYVAGLRSYGASSGVDALAGMVVAALWAADT